TADNEKEHAKKVLKLLGGVLNTTEENLEAAAGGEHHEHTSMYKEFETVAREEGFLEIAAFFKEVAEVEDEHEQRFLALLNRLREGTLFRRPQPIRWRCRNCGYVHTGTEPPQVCPACDHPRGFYEPAADNY
ncbi:MAG: rubrerythrin family protein, partial [Syntrophomonadaceae bacterium]|nr:rubrerythrin family protein [Syntrophomonadaceae bacterium]